MKLIVAIAGVLSLGAFALAHLPANPLTPRTAEPNAAPVIVELFTSEGCSSCPPADAVLDRLAATQPVSGANIIALGYHVDYWNQLGWRDPFSNRTFTDRQNRYATRFGNDGVYTPQMIVNGSAEFVGSDAGRAETEIARAAKALQNAPLTVSVRPAEGGAANSYTVRVSGAPAAKSLPVFVAVTEDDLASNVLRGENAGRHLAHVAVVRSLQLVSQQGTVRLPTGSGENRTHEHIVAWVQESETGRIRGAVQIAR